MALTIVTVQIKANEIKWDNSGASKVLLSVYAFFESLAL